ncbi:hypothetical protein QR680_013822 [Steinernema hermaphroditum]|uniref:Fatty-acid and retinol-binding protein 1 n=1 Tax=Steinernema hermaphroditum TaxID=289476 RepID=A0AA39M265_9BILA|nr:hypothetical protein QR680_013822 [Steinernema hermaphroditum]
MKFLFCVLLIVALSLGECQSFSRIKFRRYSDVFKNLVPLEVIEFYHNMTKDELHTFREVKRELFRAHLNETELSDEEINGFIQENSPSLLEKKIALEQELAAKISALPENAQNFIKSLNITNVLKPKFECDARRQCMRTLKEGYRNLSGSDKLAVVEQFPNFQRVFAWLMRFSGPEEVGRLPVKQEKVVPVVGNRMPF